MRPEVSLLRRALPYLLLTLAMFCWAGNAVLGRALRADIPPVSLAWWRWLAAALMLLPFTWSYVRRDLPVIRQNLPFLCALSILGVSTFNTLLYLALRSTTAVNTSLMQATIPAIIPILSYLCFKKQVSPKQMIGIACCIAGAVVVLMKGSLSNLMALDFSLGDLIMLLAVSLYSLYSVLLSRRPPIHAMSFLTVTFILGLFFLTPVYLWESVPFTWSPSVVLSILFVALFASIVAFFCWNYGVQALGANPAGLFMPLISVFAALLSVLFLDDPLHWYHFAGVLTIFAGIAIFNR